MSSSVFLKIILILCLEYTSSAKVLALFPIDIRSAVGVFNNFINAFARSFGLDAAAVNPNKFSSTSLFISPSIVVITGLPIAYAS